MRKKLLILATLGFVALSSCSKKCETSVTEEQVPVEEQASETEEASDVKTLNVTFSATSDSKLAGTAEFIQKGDSVTMVVNLSGLTPGEHAIHIHEKGDCSAPDGSSAGGHWNPAGTDHGKFNENAFHMGDIGNLQADENGNATLTFTTDKWCLGCEDNMKNIVGHAIIVHETADDFSTQPTGNAGGRIGCVVIE